LYLSFLPNHLKEKNARYKNWQAKTAHLLGQMLLLKALVSHRYDTNCLDLLMYDIYNRPSINDEIDFNISHSGNYVICAIAEGIRLGVDIEEIKTVDFNDFTSVMTKNEWIKIETSEKPCKEFFKHWTIKESIVKADGRGLGINLSDIIIENDIALIGEKKWHLTECSIDPEYCCFLTTSVSLGTTSIVYCDCNAYNIIL
jgi:4'-phosphopantetheinyl transferase